MSFYKSKEKEGPIIKIGTDGLTAKIHKWTNGWDINYV